MTPSFQRRHPLSIALAALLGLALPLLAQPSKTPGVDPGTSLPERFRPVQGGSGVVVLAEEPFRIDAVGLSVRLPAKCQISSNRVGGRTTAQIVPEESTWIMNIQTPQTNKADSTILEAVEQTVALMQGTYGIVDRDQTEVLTTEAKFLERTDDLTLPGGKAARLYVSTPRSNKSRLVKGYTIFKPTAHQYVVFEFICHEVDFAKLRGTFETIVGTASFANAEAMMLSRGAAIKAGVLMIQGLAEQDYLTVMGDKEVWYRLFRPGKSGSKMDDQELGYRGVKCWRGKRGELNPGRPQSSWLKTDHQEGFLAQNRSRVLLEHGAADTVAVYFMSADRGEESWTVVTSIKDENGREISSATEKGARDKAEMIIQRTASKKPSATVRPVVPPEGYLSQFETIIMPRLIAMRKAKVEMGFYCWQNDIGSDGGTVSFRRDALSGEGSTMTLTTTLRDTGQPQVSTYTDKGDLLRTDLPDGWTWEPTDLVALKRVWQQKGLPVDR